MKKHDIGSMCLSILLALCLLTAASDLFAQVNRGAGVPKDSLPETLKGLEIRDYFVPSSMKKAGVIHALEGSVVVIHRDSGDAYFGRAGDQVFENDSLNTLAGSRCRVRLFNEDLITMAEDTEFAVDSYVDQREEGRKRSFFSMMKGKAMFYAMRLFRYKDSRFTLKTPTAIVGVRGTKFGAHVYYLEPEKRAKGGILVADSGNRMAGYLEQAQARLPGQPVTLIATGDGQVDVNGMLLGRGEVVDTLNNKPTFDPTVLARIESETEVRPEGEKKEEGKAPAEEPGGEDLITDTGEGTVPLAPPSVTEDVIDTATLETGTKTADEAAAETITPFAPPLKGYFSAFLKKMSNGWVREAFIPEDLQKTDPIDDAYAYGVGTSSSYVFVDEVTNGTAGTTKGKVDLWGEGFAENSNMQGSSTYLGQYNYTQWGYYAATVTPVFVISANTYELINKFWFVEGYATDPTQVAALSGDYSYRGVVRGTYFPDNVDLTGTYSSNVHFGSSYIKDFILNASGGGHTVNFTQSGSSTIDNHGQFDISGGTFKIDGNAVSYWGVSGAHFGPHAEEQGGAWAGYCSTTNVGAWGIFAGYN